jgi:hypothetical protein
MSDRPFNGAWKAAIGAVAVALLVNTGSAILNVYAFYSEGARYTQEEADDDNRLHNLRICALEMEVFGRHNEPCE